MPGTLQSIQVGKTPQRIQTWLATNDAFLVVNNDITNQIFVGNDPGTQVIPIPPLGSISFSKSDHDLWISTGGVSVTVQALLLPAGTQWTPAPSQVAAQINALGLAKDTTVSGVNTTLVFGTNPQLNSISGGAGQSVATDMLNANKNVTGQIASILASGVPGGTPGGIPLLRYTNTLGSNAVGVTCTPGLGVNLLTKAPVNQPGYEAIFSLNLPAGVGTNPFLTLIFNWFDATTGLNIKSVFYTLSAGNGVANALQYYINGPCYGNQLSVQAINLDGAQNMTLVWGVNQTSHVFATDRIVQPVYAGTAPITFSNPGGTPGLGIISYTRAAIAANTSISRLVAAYSGKAILGVDNGGGTATIWVSLCDPAQLYQNVSTSPRMEPFVVTNGTNLVSEVALPRGPMLLLVENKNATNSVTPSITLTAMDF